MSREKILHYIFKCPELLSLNCANCVEQIDDATAEEIFKFCKGLRTVDVSRCKFIDSTSLGALQECTDLRQLSKISSFYVD
jgi:hypothetical protein